MNTLLLSLLSGSMLFASAHEQTLYNSLSPNSLSEAFAFYSLYPQSDEAKKIVLRIKKLLNTADDSQIDLLAPLVNRLKGSQADLKEEELELIESMCIHFPNRKLKGYGVKSEEEVLHLPSEEIDLGKGLILSQLQNDSTALFQARSYSAMLDLMALQILAQLSPTASPLEKIEVMNHFIFDQMHFRFPPHSAYAENIDLYTFLPSVMDNHLGVCLGVTALYLAIAQRIDLPLEIITPPGHIYIRYQRDGTKVNIETTARGIATEDETYLSIQNATLQERTLKEVIGMTHVNQASIYLYKGDYERAVVAYEKAFAYLRDDPLVKELLGYGYLLCNKIEEGKKLLYEVGPDASHTMATDYLEGKVDLEGMGAVFMLVDETRESLLMKLKELKKVTEKYPQFRDGWHQLAVTWIQLNRNREAIEALQKYHSLDKNDAIINYYLAVLHGERHDFKNCWIYLKQAEEITQKEGYQPKALKELKHLLKLHCPE